MQQGTSQSTGPRGLMKLPSARVAIWSGFRSGPCLTPYVKDDIQSRREVKHETTPAPGENTAGVLSRCRREARRA